MRHSGLRTRNSNRSHATRMAEMNVTNLVDVTMVILICFILVAPMLKHGVEIDLPQSTSQKVEVGDKHVIKLDKDERLYLNEVRVEPKKLEEDLQRIADTEEDPVIYLEADQSLTYGKVMEVMSAIKRAKIAKVGLITKKEP